MPATIVVRHRARLRHAAGARVPLPLAPLRPTFLRASPTVKLALVTTPPLVTSIVGAYAHALLPELRRQCEVEVFVAREHAGVAPDGAVLHSASELSPRRFDHVLYQIGNESHHAFMVPLVRTLGGTVVLHDWTLFEPARAAHPELDRGGAQGLMLVLREGGVGEARSYCADRERWLRGVATGAQPALNRSVVRGADAFIVHSREMKEHILIDRNAATPIAVLNAAVNQALLAREYIDFLEVCPAPRSKKKSLIKVMLEASERRRTEDAATRA